MFDFERWCSWAEAQCRQQAVEQMTLTFRRGAPSPKPGAAISFETDSRLMQLAFWETGEADFWGVHLHTHADILGFNGRVLDDDTFAPIFRDCLLVAAT